MKYLLDTNILSNITPASGGGIVARLEGLEEGAAFTSVFVASEMLYGAERRGSPKLKRRVVRLLASFEVKGVSDEFAAVFANLRLHLERAGRQIGPIDTLIAAHGLALDATVVTDNTRHFQHVPDLRIENWLRPAAAPEV